MAKDTLKKNRPTKVTIVNVDGKSQVTIYPPHEGERAVYGEWVKGNRVIEEAKFYGCFEVIKAAVKLPVSSMELTV